MVRNVRLLFLAVILPGILSCSRDTRPYAVRVKEVLSEGLTEYGVKGASAAVIMPDRSAHRVVAGFSHDTVAIHPDMLFAIESITKNVVAALVLQLAEEGALTLNDPLYRWLPTYPFIDSAITIRQLLNHTSGLYMFWDNQKIWDDLKQYRDSVFSPETVLTYIRDPYFSPGKEYRYSNTNYLLLAMICTRATQSTLSAEFRRRFWAPLKIENAWLSLEEQIPRNLAHVWGDNFENDGSTRDLTFLPRASHESITYGSSGLFMTAEDLARWSHALFRGKVLTEASLDEMLKFGKGGYGLGVGHFRSPLAGGEQAVGHMGGNIGTTASMVYSRKFGVSVVVMINTYHLKCISKLTEEVGKTTLDYLESMER